MTLKLVTGCGRLAATSMLSSNEEKVTTTVA